MARDPRRFARLDKPTVAPGDNPRCNNELPYLAPQSSSPGRGGTVEWIAAVEVTRLEQSRVVSRACPNTHKEINP